jgi:hypothetical protein
MRRPAVEEAKARFTNGWRKWLAWFFGTATFSFAVHTSFDLTRAVMDHWCKAVLEFAERSSTCARTHVSGKLEI